MISEMFRRPTKWSVMKNLIFKEVEDLVIGSLGIVAFISFFVGGVVTIQTALNINSPLIPKYLVGFATRQVRNFRICSNFHFCYHGWKSWILYNF